MLTVISLLVCGLTLQLETYLKEARVTLEEALEKLLLQLEGLPLKPHAVYALTGGKRLRPLLVLIAGEAIGGERRKLLPLAVSVELVHTATLIHDDIIDRDEERRGRPSLHVKWKDGAILAGDLLFSKAISLASRHYNSEIVSILAEAALEACNGEILDITMNFNSSEEEVLAKIRMKSASLFRAAAQCSGILAGGKSWEVEALKSYGENLGMAYQLADDLEEAENGLHGDLEAGRLTLPYLHLYQHGDSRLKSLLEKGFGCGQLPVEEAKLLGEALKAHGSLRYCKGKLAEYLVKAVESLQPLRGERKLLEDFAYYSTRVRLKEALG